MTPAPADTTTLELRMLLADWRARGLTFTLADDGSRFYHSPRHLLTDAEAGVVRTHRKQIRELLKSETTDAESTATRMREGIERIEHAARAERDEHLRTHDPSTWQVIHGRDASEVERRDREATNVMIRMLPYGHKHLI